MNSKSYLISILDVSNQAHVSQRVVRHYENIGLISSVRLGKVRWFRPSVVKEVLIIKDLLRIGFKLNEVGLLMRKTLISNIDFRNDSSDSSREDLLERLADLRQLSENLLISLKDY